MYDLIYNLIDHAYTSGDTMQQYIIYTACALILILSTVFIDMVYRIFSRFWRRG